MNPAFSIRKCTKIPFCLLWWRTAHGISAGMIPALKQWISAQWGADIQSQGGIRFGLFSLSWNSFFTGSCRRWGKLKSLLCITLEEQLHISMWWLQSPFPYKKTLFQFASRPELFQWSDLPLFLTLQQAQYSITLQRETKDLAAWADL